MQLQTLLYKIYSMVVDRILRDLLCGHGPCSSAEEFVLLSYFIKAVMLELLCGGCFTETFMQNCYARAALSKLYGSCFAEAMRELL